LAPWGKDAKAPNIKFTHKVFDRFSLYLSASPLSAPKWSFFYPKRNEVFAGNPISMFSNPKGRIAPKSIDFEGLREYTGSMND